MQAATTLLATAAVSLALASPAEAWRRGRVRVYVAPRAPAVVVHGPRVHFSYGPTPYYSGYRGYYAPRVRSYHGPSYGYGYVPRGRVYRDRDDWEDYRDDYEDWLEDREEEYEDRMEDLRERQEERWEDWRDRWDD